MENEIVVLNASEFLLTDFTEQLSLVNKKYHSNNWFVKLRELDAAIHHKGLQNKINMSDDRNVLIVFKVMAETNMFIDGTAGVKEWFIVKRYLEIYAQPDVTHLEELRKFVGLNLASMHVGHVSKEEAIELKRLSEMLNNIEYEFLPVFVLDAFANEQESERKVKKEYTLQDTLRMCDIMIAEDPSIGMTPEEIQMWVDFRKKILKEIEATKNK